MDRLHETFWGLVLPDGRICTDFEGLFHEVSYMEIERVRQEEISKGYTYMCNAVPTKLKIVPV